MISRNVARNDLTPPNTNITRHFLNIIIRTAGLSSLRIDSYVYSRVAVEPPAVRICRRKSCRITLINPTHRAVSRWWFLAIAYGYGNVRSYGYNAGTNMP